MADIIRLLPDSVANKIAAGEVIQRPASVIKELIENAVDAGATEIQVFIKDAGRTLIQVIDNGKGMSEVDARMAFERHATSKIKDADDLFSLTTMGFRGEALPSICAVSQVELRTKTSEDTTGIRLCINGSKLETHEACVCETGCNFMVRNLFFNVPARRKFLKTDSVELANIMREFERLALVNNNLRMSIDTGSRKISLLPGSFKQRIADIWKNNLNMELLPISVDTSIVKITGFVSRPEHARKRNPLQYFIVNGRNMRDPYFHSAVVNCFESLIAPGTKPCYFIKLEVDPATIDVNIHPTKNEIKFENAKEIWRLLTSAVRASLGANSAVPSIDFESEMIPLSVLPEGEHAEAPELDIPEGYNPFASPGGVSGGYTPQKSVGSGRSAGVSSAWKATKVNKEWERLFDGFMDSNSELPDSEAVSESGVLPGVVSEPTSFCMQLSQKFILATSRDGLLIIDQHRAHLKVLYEQFLSSTTSVCGSTQRVMFPEILYFDESQELVFESVEDYLKRIGFTFTPNNGTERSWRIEGVPSVLSNGNPSDIIMSIIESISDDNAGYEKEDNAELQIRRKVALIMARCSAINRGTRLTSAEMENLVGQLMSLPDPALTPYGKCIYKTIPLDKIEKWF